MTDKVALIDLDNTIADYDGSMGLQMISINSPSETYQRYDVEPPYIEARRKLIQRQPGFWERLNILPMGIQIVDELRQLQFTLHVLTKGPASCPAAWSEKVKWCRAVIPDALVTVTEDKSLTYGRVLVDDYPPYFEKWLLARPRGLVICVAHHYNKDFAKGGSKEHPNVLRFDGSNINELKIRLKNQHDRIGGYI